jgi:hypothetical protein
MELSHAKCMRKLRPRRGSSETIHRIRNHSHLYSTWTRHTVASFFRHSDLCARATRQPPVSSLLSFSSHNSCYHQSTNAATMQSDTIANQMDDLSVKEQPKNQVTPRSTRRLSISPRQRDPSTTSPPTPRPTAQSRAQSHSRSLRLVWSISPRLFLPLSRLPLHQSHPTRLSSSRRSTSLPPSDLPTYKPPSLVLLCAIQFKLPPTASAAPSLSNPSTSTILPSATPFLRPAILPARTTRSIRHRLTSFCPQSWPSAKNTAG